MKLIWYLHDHNWMTTSAENALQWGLEVIFHLKHWGLPQTHVSTYIKINPSLKMIYICYTHTNKHTLSHTSYAHQPYVLCAWFLKYVVIWHSIWILPWQCLIIVFWGEMNESERA